MSDAATTEDTDPFDDVLEELPDLEEGDRVEVRNPEKVYQNNERKLTVEKRGFSTDVPVKTGVLSGAKDHSDGEVDGYILSGYGTEYYLFVCEWIGARDDELTLSWKSRPLGRPVTEIEVLDQ